MTNEDIATLTRPIPNISLRAPEEVFDMMCARIRGHRLGFNEDHSVGPSREGGSVKRSHRADGRNWID